MVSLWPTRHVEGGATDNSKPGATSGSIEMKGNKRSDIKQNTSGFWPVSTLRSQQLHQSRDTGGNRNDATLGTPGTGAAFLQTVIQANTPAVILCSPRAAQNTSEVTSEVKLEEEQRGSTPPRSVTEGQTDTNPADEQEYDEVQFLVRVPRPQTTSTACSVSTSGKSLDELEEELQMKEQQRKQAAKALAVKNQECKDLLKIIRELTESRNKLSSSRAIQAERMADLQHDYMRMSRVADLSRAVSKENLAKTTEVTRRFNQAEEELARQKLVNQQGKERYARLKIENMELREKISLLERLDVFTYHRDSACMVEFKHYHLKETY